MSLNDMDKLFKTFISIKKAEGKAKLTIDEYYVNYRYFVRYLDSHGIDRKFNNLSRKLFRDYIRYMQNDAIQFEDHRFKTDKQRKKGLSATTINHRLKTLRTIFNTLLEEELIDRNPTAGVKNVPNPQENTTVLASDELKRLLKAPDKSTYAGFRDLALMHVLIDGMMRISEATHLKESDFDFRANTVTIRAAIAKSRKARTLPLRPVTMRLVSRLIDSNKEDFSTDYVFLVNYGEPLLRDHFRKRLKEHAETARIKKNVYPHILRHTAATLFLEDGGSIRHLQTLLGHADLRMVVRYTHLSDKAVTEQHEQHSAINQVTSKMSRPRKRKL